MYASVVVEAHIQARREAWFWRSAIWIVRELIVVLKLFEPRTVHLGTRVLLLLLLLLLLLTPTSHHINITSHQHQITSDIQHHFQHHMTSHHIRITSNHITSHQKSHSKSPPELHRKSSPASLHITTSHHINITSHHF